MVHYLLACSGEFADLQIVSVASVFWSVSAGLASQSRHAAFPGRCMIILVSEHRGHYASGLSKLPPPARFLAKSGDYALDAPADGGLCPDFVSNASIICGTAHAMDPTRNCG